MAIELLLGLRVRATKDDLDAAARTTSGEIEGAVQTALANGWDGFGFRLLKFQPIRHTGARRATIKVDYRGRAFCTVQFEASPAEGAAGQETAYVSNAFIAPEALGLAPVGDVPIVTVAYLLAQKLTPAPTTASAATGHAT